jgi:hypothetical protein
MKKTGLIVGILLGVLSHPAMAEDIARACAVDAERLCRVPAPVIEDFKKGGTIYNCLERYLTGGQLSRSCYDAIMSR